MDLLKKVIAHANSLGGVVWAVIAGLAGALWLILRGEEFKAAQFFADILRWIGAYVALHPLRSLGTLLLCIGFTLLVRYGRRIWAHWKNHTKLVNDHAVCAAELMRLKPIHDDIVAEVQRLRSEKISERQLLDASGLFGYRPHLTRELQEENWKAFKERASRPENRTIYILGATGLATFGHPRSPLHDLIQGFTGHIRVMLLDPQSPFVDERVAAIPNTNKRKYKKEITTSIDFLASLSKKGKDIEVRTYSTHPGWKIIMTGNSLWLQHYPPGDHVDETPVYTFYSTESENGLYDYFAVEYLRLWGTAKPIAL